MAQTAKITLKNRYKFYVSLETRKKQNLPANLQ